MVSWCSILSLCHLVPSGRLRMRSLQLLRQQWDFVDKSVVLQWSPEIASDLAWWSDASHLLSGVSRAPPSGRPLLVQRLGSGLGGKPPRPVRFRPVVSRGGPPLHQPQRVVGDSPGVAPLRSFVEGAHHGVFADNTTALAYLRRQGGTFSPALNREAQLLLRWAESLQIRLVPQFIMGSRNVVVDSLSRWDQNIGSEWTLAQEVVLALQRRWPVTIDLFATILNYRLSVYFSPLNDPVAAGGQTLSSSCGTIFRLMPFPRSL